MRRILAVSEKFGIDLKSNFQQMRNMRQSSEFAANHMCRLTIAILVTAVFTIGCNEQTVQDLPKGKLNTHYLIDYEYTDETTSPYSTWGYLSVFNPNGRAAQLTITVFFEDRDPLTFSQTVPAKTSTIWNDRSWPIKDRFKKFALKIESTEPVISQATIGWENDNYKVENRLKGRERREAAKSYMAINQLNKDWYLADGVVMHKPKEWWIKESEWAILLNPGDQKAQVRLLIYDGGEMKEHKLEIPPRRLKHIFMDEVVAHNKHYGAHFISDQPIAAQWLRTLHWYDSPEVMSFWSVPLAPRPSR